MALLQNMDGIQITCHPFALMVKPFPLSMRSFFLMEDTHTRHSELRGTFAKVLRDVCFAFEVQPSLPPLPGESFKHKTATVENGIRLNIKAKDSRFSITFSNVKLFNPFGKICPKSIPHYYALHENQKNTYEPRIVENSSFNPLVLTCTERAGPSATRNEASGRKDRQLEERQLR